MGVLEMLVMKKTSVTLEPEQIMELEYIVTDEDMEGALIFLKRHIYNTALKSQQGQLKSHLDGHADPVGDFK